jgi:GNAT superfamily N-acetyltransferase
LVAELDEHLVGFAVLLVESPPDWSDPLNTFPIVVDLFVTEAYRNCGVGQALIQQIEAIATAHGKPAVYLSVEPLANPRALAFYTRLGFVQLQDHPYHNTWHFRDSDGQLHTGEEWVIDMRKSLSPDVAHPANGKDS